MTNNENFDSATLNLTHAQTIIFANFYMIQKSYNNFVQSCTDFKRKIGLNVNLFSSDLSILEAKTYAPM